MIYFPALTDKTNTFIKKKNNMIITNSTSEIYLYLKSTFQAILQLIIML